MDEEMTDFEIWAEGQFEIIPERVYEAPYSEYIEFLHEELGE